MTPGWATEAVDAVYVANMGAGMLQHQTAIASALVDRLSLLPAAADTHRERPGLRRFGGQERPAGGGLRLLRHCAGGGRREDARGHRLARHRFRRHHDPPEAEYPYGITLPGMAGMFTRLYMEKYGVTREMLVGGGAQEPGDGHAQPLRACRDGAHQRRHLRQPGCGRQQPGGG